LICETERVRNTFKHLQGKPNDEGGGALISVPQGWSNLWELCSLWGISFQMFRWVQKDQ
jgi:hypothetical protein